MDWHYKPAGRVTSAFLKSNAFVRGLRGPIGSGKSTACCMDIMRRAKLQAPGPDGKRRSRWAVIRNSYPELKTTTIKTWHQWFPPELGKWRDEGPPTHRVTLADLDLEVMFIALDRPEDIRRLLSLELTGGWINEAREVPKAILDALTGRVGRYPPQRDGGATWSGVIMDTNPPDSDHWWYRLAEEDKPDGFDFFAQPSGRSPNAENLPNLIPGYYDRLIAGKTEEWVKVYADGDYGYVQDGKPVYPEFRDGLHVREIQPDPRFPISIGLDFGLTPAATFGQKLHFGRWIIFDELVCEDMGAKQFGELLGPHIRETYRDFTIGGIWGDPSGDHRAQTDKSTPFQILKAAGIHARPAPSNDFVLRREAVASCLSRLIEGVPGLIISPRCRVLRKGMAGAYRYRRMQVPGMDRYADKPDKNMFSHVCESAQYLLLGGGEGKEVVRRTGVARPGQADTDYNMFGG